jgi:hypothetical protein
MVEMGDYPLPIGKLLYFLGLDKACPRRRASIPSTAKMDYRLRGNDKLAVDSDFGIAVEAL